MGWFTSLPNAVLIQKYAYFEERPSPVTDGVVQVRGHIVTINEYRGLSESLAEDEAGSSIFGLTVTTRVASATGGGSYTLVVTEDKMVTGWVNL